MYDAPFVMHQVSKWLYAHNIEYKKFFHEEAGLLQFGLLFGDPLSV